MKVNLSSWTFYHDTTWQWHLITNYTMKITQITLWKLLCCDQKFNNHIVIWFFKSYASDEIIRWFLRSEWYDNWNLWCVISVLPETNIQDCVWYPFHVISCFRLKKKWHWKLHRRSSTTWIFRLVPHRATPPHNIQAPVAVRRPVKHQAVQRLVKVQGVKVV